MFAAIEQDIREVFKRNKEDLELFREEFKLSFGTPEVHTGFKLKELDHEHYYQIRKQAINLARASHQFTEEELRIFFSKAADTLGGKAFLNLFVGSLRASIPDVFEKTWALLEKKREECELEPDEVGCKKLQSLRRRLIELTISRIYKRVWRDSSRPLLHAAMPSGWVNDPVGLYYDNDRLHVHFQHNPFSEAWNHMHWGHGMWSEEGRFEVFEGDVLEPRPEDGYVHVFSGSVAKIPDPEKTDKNDSVFAAFFTAVGPGKEWSFREAPPILMAIFDKANSVNGKSRKWRSKRFEIINSMEFGTRQYYDVRDPYVFERDGRFFMLLAGSSEKRRMGGGVILLFAPKDNLKVHEKWGFRGCIFEHEITKLEDGGPGILECPNICRLTDGHSDVVKDVLIFCSQRKDGLLSDFRHHQCVEYRVGEFDSENCQFTFDERKDNLPLVVDWGRAFYAACLVQQPEAQRNRGSYKATLIGWVSGFDTRSDWHNLCGGQRGWCGCATFPRTLTLKNNQIHVAPDEKILEGLRKDVIWENKSIRLEEGLFYKAPVDASTIEINAKLTIDRKDSCIAFSVLAESETEGLLLQYDGARVTVGDEWIPLPNASKEGHSSIEIQVLIDRTVIEVYTGCGRVLTKVATPLLRSSIDRSRLLAGHIFYWCKGSARIDRIKISTLGTDAEWALISANSERTRCDGCSESGNESIDEYGDWLCRYHCPKSVHANDGEQPFYRFEKCTKRKQSNSCSNPVDWRLFL